VHFFLLVTMSSAPRVTPAPARGHRMAVADTNCVRYVSLGFVIGTVFGFVLNNRVRRWLG
jgi:hypothetical protein